jgi:hypothetical protein
MPELLCSLICLFGKLAGNGWRRVRAGWDVLMAMHSMWHSVTATANWDVNGLQKHIPFTESLNGFEISHTEPNCSHSMECQVL